MTIPKISFKATNTKLEAPLTDLMERKLSSLDRLVPDNTDNLCDVEFEKVTGRNNGSIHRVEVNLTVDGKLYRAESTQESFSEAIDKVRDELDKELRRSKSKRDTLIKKGGRELKKRLLGKAAA